MGKALRSVEVHTSLSSDMKIHLAVWPILLGIFTLLTITKAQPLYQEGVNGEMEENILCGIPGYSFLCSSAYDLSKRAGGGSYLFRSRRTTEDPGIDKRSYQSRMNRGSYLFRTRRAEEEDEDENVEGFDLKHEAKTTCSGPGKWIRTEDIYSVLVESQLDNEDIDQKT